MPDMATLLAQAQQLQEQVLAAQAELAKVQVSGSAGNGAVTATVTATGELIGLEISPAVVDPADVETLADLVVAAIRDATRAAGEVTAATMGPFAAGMGLGGDIMNDLGLGDFAIEQSAGGDGSAFGLPPGR
ncbi:MAG: YbaB/EbfC family nucleoid-associated protein [Sporichthyaceae bacterium]